MGSLRSPSTVSRSISVRDPDDCDGLCLRAALRDELARPHNRVEGGLSTRTSSQCSNMVQSKAESYEGSMARAVAAAPQRNAASSSELHVSDYSLPSSSRLPKGILGIVAGTIVLVAGLYYAVKWVCRSKLGSGEGDEDYSDDERPVTVIVVTDLGPAGATKLAIERAARLQLEAIPAIRYEEWLRRDAARAGAEEEEEEACAVCLGELSGVGSMVKVLPGCGHCFHSSCIDVWLVARASCPVCRAKL